MDELSQIHSEYGHLRDEIMQADARNYQILGIMLAGAAALLAASVGKGESGLFAALVVYAVTIPGYGMLCANRRRIWRISTYMRVFLEPKLVFTQWETRLNAQREGAKESQRQGLSSLANTTEWLAVTLVNLAAAVASGWAILALAQGLNWRSISGLCVLALLNVALLMWTSSTEIGLRRLGRREQELLASWEALSSRESGRAAAQ